MEASVAAYDLIKKYEGLKLKAYKAVSSEKYYTIGYGHYGADVDKNLTITKDVAEHLLVVDVAKAEVAVNKYENIYHFTQNQFDALVSFAYNIGSIDQLTAKGVRDIPTIAMKIKQYTKAGGKELAGLVRRRNEEYALFCSGNDSLTDTNAYINTAINCVRGLYGDGETRKNIVENLGYEYEQVQSHVNKMYAIAKDVKAGKYGNMPERKQKVEKTGYPYDYVQEIVNILMEK